MRKVKVFCPLFILYWKLRQSVCGQRHPISLLSISVGLWVYAKASPFSLALAMLGRDQVLSFLSELKFLKKKKAKTASSCLILATALVTVKIGQGKIKWALSCLSWMLPCQCPYYYRVNVAVHPSSWSPYFRTYIDCQFSGLTMKHDGQ